MQNLALRQISERQNLFRVINFVKCGIQTGVRAHLYANIHFDRELCSSSPIQNIAVFCIFAMATSSGDRRYIVGV